MSDDYRTRSPLEEEFFAVNSETAEEKSEAERKVKAALDERRRFLRHLMEADMFREWLYEVLTEFSTFNPPFGASPTGFPDPLHTQFLQGKAKAGWRLWTIFDDAAPDLASLMRREGEGRA